MSILGLEGRCIDTLGMMGFSPLLWLIVKHVPQRHSHATLAASRLSTGVLTTDITAGNVGTISAATTRSCYSEIRNVFQKVESVSVVRTAPPRAASSSPSGCSSISRSISTCSTGSAAVWPG
jgi:hypothetical protein